MIHMQHFFMGWDIPQECEKNEVVSRLDQNSFIQKLNKLLPTLTTSFAAGLHSHNDCTRICEEENQTETPHNKVEFNGTGSLRQ